jgi:hypothetical protein
MGKLIGGIVKIILTTIAYIPFIGKPLANAIIFILENLISLIKKLPYIIGFGVVAVFAAIFFGII